MNAIPLGDVLLVEGRLFVSAELLLVEGFLLADVFVVLLVSSELHLVYRFLLVQVLFLVDVDFLYQFFPSYKDVYK